MSDSAKIKYELQYNEDQKSVVRKGSSNQDSDFGRVDDLNPRLYSADQMFWISVGRGSDKSFGNIDDLDPANNNWNDMFMISRERARKS